MPWLDKHTFPLLARSTLNELQQNQHEKASLVCVRVQSPSGLALVPCALSMVDLSGQLRCWITQTSLVQNNVWFFILAPYARTTRYEEAFLPKGKKRPRSLRSLGLASLSLLILLILLLLLTPLPLQYCEFCNRSGTLQRWPSGSVTDPIPYRDYPYPTEPIRGIIY